MTPSFKQHLESGMNIWQAGNAEWESAPVNLESPVCVLCGRDVENMWTGPKFQSIHDRCWAERNGLDPDRYVWERWQERSPHRWTP